MISCCKDKYYAIAFSSKHTKHALADTETTSKYVKKVLNFISPVFSTVTIYIFTYFDSVFCTEYVDTVFVRYMPPMLRVRRLILIGASCTCRQLY